MALPWDKREFGSWRQALARGELDPAQMAVLEDMVRKGTARDVEAAAEMLDWQDTVVDPDGHMYGM